jgi:hypothetical protein
VAEEAAEEGLGSKRLLLKEGTTADRFLQSNVDWGV